jgi:hypothetical protein
VLIFDLVSFFAKYHCFVEAARARDESASTHPAFVLLLPQFETFFFLVLEFSKSLACVVHSRIPGPLVLSSWPTEFLQHFDQVWNCRRR